MFVSGGYIDFLVTGPSNDVVYRVERTSYDNFEFTANESGTYEMHFANNYQVGDVNVTLTYGINFRCYFN